MMWKKTAVTLLIIVLCYIGVLLYFVRQEQRKITKDQGTSAQEVLTVWYWDGSIIEIFDRYIRDTGKQVRLNYVNVSIADYARQLKSAISISNDLPDICLLQDYYAGNFLSLPVWEDLGGGQYGSWVSDFPSMCGPYITSPSGRLVAVPYNLDAAGLAYREEKAREIFGIESPEEAMEMFPTWDALIEASMEKKGQGKEFMLFNCLGDVASMMFNQTEKPYIVRNTMVEPERFLNYFRYLSRLYKAGLVGDTAQVSIEWSEDYKDDNYMMAPWSLWLSQYEAFSVNPNEDWVLIDPPGGSFKWGGMVCCIPASSPRKEAAWDFIRYMTQTEEGALADKEAKCGQLIYYKYENCDADYKRLNIKGFGGQDVGTYFMDSLMKERYERPLSEWDLELDEVFHLAVDAIVHEPGLTPEEVYGYFLDMLKSGIPNLMISPQP